MLSITDLKNNTKITLDNQPYSVVKYEHSKMGRGGAVVRTTLRNLKDGSMLPKTFQGSDKIEPADIQHRKAQFTYSDGDIYNFMDNQSYEQAELSKDVLGDSTKFLVDGMDVDVMYYNDVAINVTLAPKVELKVIETPPGVKGDTVTGGTKPATLETGFVINVPLFINEGDVVRVNVDEKSYVERV